ncbi:MAG: DUF5686 and carboxypeptidase regulatory-like domain-containing protein, partial [Bacteroidales bacterium]|nr:DUF5686 and carboxypeptidase regulatory-like domain-containing protein [Bacteroidales bacterium]
MKNQNTKPRKQTLCFCLIVFLCTFSFGQRTVVSGTVLDKESGEPIPYANIAFKHSSVGTITDFKGYFYIDTKLATDTLLASYVGYKPNYVSIKVNSTQKVEINLSSNVHALDEIVVTPGENPAFIYLDKIKERKKFNNPDRFSSMSYKTYNKLRLDLNNINDELTQRRVLRKFQFVFENMDSSEVFGKTYLPVLITESVSNFYYQKKPKVEREVIEAYKMSGIENTSFAQFTGKMYQKLNIYDDFMTYIEPGFVSPIADFGKLYYKYYLEDSAYFDDSWCYKISFKPKRKRERVFYGYFWVADTSWALKKVQLRVASDVNINFVNDMMAITEFQKVNDSLWFIKNEEILIDFNLGEETYGFFGRKYASYSDIKVNTDLPKEISEIKTDTYILEEKLKRDDGYWEENRTLKLSEDDANVYDMVDSVKKIPLFNTVFTFADMIYSYYLDAGPLEIGPYYTFYSHNPIEGHRLKFGARTSSEFSETYRFGGHLAYGTYDK